MGQIRKINDIYYIEFHARGLLYSQVGGSTLEEAQKLLGQVEEKIAQGEALTIVRYIDLPDFYERFLSDAKTQFSSLSVGRFSSTIKHFNGFLQEYFPQVGRLDCLTPAIIESYKVYLAKTQKPTAVNLTILLLRDILEFGIKLGFLNDNPSLHVRLQTWTGRRTLKETPRYKLAGQLLSKGTGLARTAQLLKLADIARMIYYANLIPLSREDVWG